MSSVNNNEDMVPYGFLCDAVCSGGCTVGGAVGCSWLCALDGPLPFIDASALISIGTAGGLSSASALGLAKTW